MMTWRDALLLQGGIWIGIMIGLAGAGAAVLLLIVDWS